MIEPTPLEKPERAKPERAKPRDSSLIRIDGTPPPTHYPLSLRHLRASCRADHRNFAGGIRVTWLTLFSNSLHRQGSQGQGRAEGSPKSLPEDRLLLYKKRQYIF